MPPAIGLSLNGKQLPRVPGNGSPDDTKTIVNQIVDLLNSNTQDIVATGTVQFSFVGTDAQDILIVPHNLGYSPRATCFLNGVHLTIDPQHDYPDIDIPLPTYLGANINGSGGGGGIPAVAFSTWLDFWVDSTNLYIHVINAASITKSFPVTYELRRVPAN